VLFRSPGEFGADRDEVMRALEADDIESRPTWKPLHMQPVFGAEQTVGGDVARGVFEQGLCLPSGSNLSDADLDRVVEIVTDSCISA